MSVTINYYEPPCSSSDEREISGAVCIIGSWPTITTQDLAQEPKHAVQNILDIPDSVTKLRRSKKLFLSFIVRPIPILVLVLSCLTKKQVILSKKNLKSKFSEMELENEKVEKQIPPQFAEVILKLNNNLKDPEIILAEVSVPSPSDINSDKSSVSESVERTGWMKYLGMILAVLSGLFYSLVLLLVKVLDAYHPFSLSAWRQLGNVIPSIPMVLYFRYWRNEPIFDEVWPLGVNHNWKHVVGLGFRGCLGATVVILRFYSLEYLTIADSTVVSYSGPIFIVIMAHFILNEKCGVTPIITGLWTLLGVILILRPPFLTGNEMNTQLLIGAGISLASVLCQSGVTILVRKIRKIHFSVMTLAFGCFGLLQSLIVTFSAGVFSVPQGPRDIFLTALLALLSFCGQIGIIVALKLEQAGPVSLIRSCDIIFVFLLQIIFLNVLPDLFSILGACIVIVGVFVTAARKWLSTLPDDSPRKQTFSFLLR